MDMRNFEEYTNKICEILNRDINYACEQCPLHQCAERHGIVSCTTVDVDYPRETMLAIYMYFKKENKIDSINPIVVIK